MSTSMGLTPRYGRDYKSKAAAIADWADGKDFTVSSMFDPDRGRAVSIRDSNTLIERGIGSVSIRYKGLTMVAVVPLAMVEVDR